MEFVRDTYAAPEQMRRGIKSAVEWTIPDALDNPAGPALDSGAVFNRDFLAGTIYADQPAEWWQPLTFSGRDL